MAEDRAPSLNDDGAPIRATVAGTKLELIESGVARLEAILELIRGAEHSVRLLFYIYVGDASGTAVRDAMVEAAARGVQVKLLLDNFGSSSLNPNFFKPLAERGGEFCLFNPAYGRSYLLRNHQKLAVADERRALIGGANIEDCYLVDEGPGHWRDLWLAIDGPVVKSAADYFDAIYRWSTAKDSKMSSLRRLVGRHSDRRGPLQWHFSAPLTRRTPWPAIFARDLHEATRVEMIQAYFSAPGSMLRRLGRVAGRGRVRIITSGKSDNNATIGAARHSYSRMLRRGVEMYEYQAARLHTKLAIVDDAVHIGSANFDFRSLYINLEITLRIKDARFAAAMRGYFERERADSEQITAELHRKRANVWRRFKWMISHWLVTSMDYNVTRRLNLTLER
ncbi:MAG TPA: phosphatidylserine/phosphatidylglycerophosphate/cardiolipin synthase family protein [Sphingomicrobium sp.]|nr:phosphatidylserine/phosphatidylglycerophosphate/cardiolipin synthase family protein [Sphingomicrobium sp.]